MNYEVFLESIAMEASHHIETCEMGLYSAMEESVYEVIVEGNESPSSEKSIKAFIKRMVEAIKDFFKKALARFQAFFHKEKNPLSEVEEYLKKHPEHKNIKVKIPDLKETEKDIEDTRSILSRIKLKLQKGKIDKKDIEEINSKKNSTAKKVIFVSLITAVALVGNSIRKLKKNEKETIKEIEDFSSHFPSVMIASDTATELYGSFDNTNKKIPSFRDENARKVYSRKKKVMQSLSNKGEYMETYLSDISTGIVNSNKNHMNCIDRAIGTIFGVWKRLENKGDVAAQRGFEIGKERTFGEHPMHLKDVRDYVNKDSTKNTYDDLGYDMELHFAKKFLN